MGLADYFTLVFACRRLKAYPKGNEKATYLAYRANNLALYLNVANSKSFPIGWTRHTKFSLTLVNQKSEKLSKLTGYCSLCLLYFMVYVML